MNQTLTSLVNDVYTLTNRPDLVGETLYAIKTATLKAHNLDYFYKDLFETGIQFDAPANQQSLNYKDLIPRWKSVKYLRAYNYDSLGNGAPGQILELITPEQVLDSYGCNKENIYYVAGAELQIRTSVATQYFLVGCYLSPDVTNENYKSWIADEQPAAITLAAAAMVFKTIGYDEQAASYDKLTLEQYAELRLTGISANGY